jgi:hypothetical protein
MEAAMVFKYRALVVLVSGLTLSCSGAEQQTSLLTTGPSAIVGGGSALVAGPTDHGTLGLTGTVTNTSGERIPGAIITILDGENVGHSAGTNENGVYAFCCLVASNANLSATKYFYAEKRDGLYIDGAATMNFVLSPAVVALTGNVKSSSGAVISGATVTVLDGPNKDRSVTTNSNGDYRFDELTAGNTNFEVTASGHGSTRAGVAVDGTNTLNFVLNQVQSGPSLSISATRITGGGGLVPQEWEFVAVLTGSATIESYEWNFGDGHGATTVGNSEHHVYTEQCVCTVTVIATQTNGSTLRAELAEVRVD